MSDFEERARAAADALGTERGAGDPAVVRRRLRRRRAVRAVASSAAVVVGIAAFAVARNDGPVRVGTVGSTAGTSTSILGGSTTSSPTTAASPPPTIPLPDATGAPALLVATDQGCVRRVLGAADVIAAVTSDARTCFALSDGSIVVERGASGSPTVLTRFVAGAAPVDLPLTNPVVLGAGDIAGRAVLFVVLHAAPATDNEAPITIYDVASASQRTFGFGSGGDSGTSRVTTDGRVIVASENADMGVGARYYNVDGTDAVGMPDLSSQMQAYPSQDVVHMVISPDGKRLAYLDGPALLDGSSDPNDNWALVVVDVETGHELQRTVLSTGRDEYSWLDYDGRWAVASRIGCADGCVARAAVVVDTQASHPAPAQIPGAVGTATLDSVG